jgi:hypothetical protein
MTRRNPLPEQLDPHGFSVGQARDAGMSRSRSRAADLEAPWRGIRVSPMAQRDVVDLCRAYLPRLLPGQHFSHTTAARLYGIPLPRSIETESILHVSAAKGVQPPRATFVVGHRAAAGVTVRTWRGMPVCAPEGLWLQLAGILDADRLVVAGDHLVRRKRPQSTIDRLRAEVANAVGRRYIAAARAALEQLRPGTDSPMETRLRLIIVRGGLPEPVIGHTVHSKEGEFIGTPDLAYIEEKIAIEYQGQVHQSDPQTYADDVIRREQFEEAGWQVIPVYKHHVNERPTWIVSRISAVLQKRAPRAQ